MLCCSPSLHPTPAASLRELLSRPGDMPADDAAFISIDGRGADVRVRMGGEYSVERIGFERVSWGGGAGWSASVEAGELGWSACVSSWVSCEFVGDCQQCSGGTLSAAARRRPLLAAWKRQAASGSHPPTQPPLLACCGLRRAWSV